MTIRRHALVALVAAAILILGMLAECAAADRLTVIDGDTVRLGTETHRLLGYDAPESHRPRCEAERALARKARSRLRQLIAGARNVGLAPSGRRDRYGRMLTRLLLDERDVAEVLIGEGLARPYAGGTRQSWCEKP